MRDSYVSLERVLPAFALLTSSPVPGNYEDAVKTLEFMAPSASDAINWCTSPTKTEAASATLDPLTTATDSKPAPTPSFIPSKNALIQRNLSDMCKQSLRTLREYARVECGINLTQPPAKEAYMRYLDGKLDMMSVLGVTDKMYSGVCESKCAEAIKSKKADVQANVIHPAHQHLFIYTYIS